MDDRTHVNLFLKILVINPVPESLTNDLDVNRSSNLWPRLWEIANSFKRLAIVGFEFGHELWVLLSEKSQDLPDIVQCFRGVDHRSHDFFLPNSMR